MNAQYLLLGHPAKQQTSESSKKAVASAPTTDPVSWCAPAFRVPVSAPLPSILADVLVLGPLRLLCVLRTTRILGLSPLRIFRHGRKRIRCCCLPVFWYNWGKAAPRRPPPSGQEGVRDSRDCCPRPVRGSVSVGCTLCRAEHWTGAVAEHWTGAVAEHWTGAVAEHWTDAVAEHWTGAVVEHWTGASAHGRLPLRTARMQVNVSDAWTDSACHTTGPVRRATTAHCSDCLLDSCTSLLPCKTAIAMLSLLTAIFSSYSSSWECWFIAGSSQGRITAQRLAYEGIQYVSLFTFELIIIIIIIIIYI